MRKGVTDSITVLIIVALTFAAVFVFSAFGIGNVHGLSGSTHRLQVYGDSKLVINKTSGEAYAIIRLYADMKPAVVIDHLIVGKYVSNNVTILEVLQGNPRVEDGKLILPVGSYVVVRYDLPAGAADNITREYWGYVTGNLITGKGFLYKVTLKLVVVGEG
jgi:hypothetical protein